jgi:hypothetical protein
MSDRECANLVVLFCVDMLSTSLVVGVFKVEEMTVTII